MAQQNQKLDEELPVGFLNLETKWEENAIPED